MTLPRILVVDDNKARTQQLEIVLRFMEYQVETATSLNYDECVDEAATLLVIFLGNGIAKQAAVLRALEERTHKSPVILLIDKGCAHQLTTAMGNLVFHVLEWPVTYPELKRVIDQLPNASSPQPVHPDNSKENPGTHNFSAIERLQGISRAIANVRKLIHQVAESDATVLILGESGTGKEVVARALHETSGRRSKSFVPINCGAIPGELLESELFGHEKGAFTGALSARQGRFEMAEGGTLFLDEIGDMPMTMQVKLLRVLQERTFERVGSNKTIHCDVRIIAATHRSLDDEIKDNRFREDLFYRLNVFPIEMPALRERPEDIPLLVADLVARMQASNRGSVQLTNAALAVLMQHEWPGNIRELANLIERLAIIYPKGLVDVADLPEKFRHYNVPEGLVATAVTEAVVCDTDDDNEPVVLAGVSEDFIGNGAGAVHLAQLPEQGIDLKEYLNIMEIDLIRQALEECNGVVAHAAKRLNMRRTTLVEKLRKYELQR
ncbi:MAG: sigma-54 dependent transcriptional regulator [Methylovulum sp.]|nr:sigma-54 dependent transcriptional regulator [Methylovulum sp.]